MDSEPWPSDVLAPAECVTPAQNEIQRPASKLRCQLELYFRANKFIPLTSSVSAEKQLMPKCSNVDIPPSCELYRDEQQSEFVDAAFRSGVNQFSAKIDGSSASAVSQCHSRGIIPADYSVLHGVESASNLEFDNDDDECVVNTSRSNLGDEVIYLPSDLIERVAASRSNQLLAASSTAVLDELTAKKGGFYVEGDDDDEFEQDAQGQDRITGSPGENETPSNKTSASPCAVGNLRRYFDAFAGESSSDLDYKIPATVMDDLVPPHQSSYKACHQSAKMSIISDLLRNDIQQIDDDLVETKHHKPPKIIDGHLIMEEIGYGAYARVKQCVHLESLERRAVKIIKMEKLRKIRDALDDVEREVRLLLRFRHKNVVRMYQYRWMPTKGKLYVFLNLCRRSLQQMLDQAPGRRLHVDVCRFYSSQLFDGLLYLHSQNVAHKDVKAGNLLVTVDHVIKLVDFGVSDEIDPYDQDHLSSNTRGTPKFQPPEIAQGARRFDGFKVDVWCSGVTLYNMASSRYPFDGSTIFVIYDRIANQPLVLPEEIQDVELRRLLDSMLQKCVNARATVADARRHVWTCSVAENVRSLLDKINVEPLTTNRSGPSECCAETWVNQRRPSKLYDHLENLLRHETLEDDNDAMLRTDNGRSLYVNRSDPYIIAHSKEQQFDASRNSFSANNITNASNGKSTLPSTASASLRQRPVWRFSLRNVHFRLKMADRWQPRVECNPQ